MPLCRLVILCLFCKFLGPASTVQSQILPAQGASQPRTISGVVVNSVTGQPIPRALVQVGQHAMLTNNEGHFEFQNVTDIAIPTATKPGYFPENSTPSMLAYPANGDPAPMQLRLAPEAIVSGRVTDESGEPLEGIPVVLRAFSASEGLKHWEQGMATVTNAEGEFRFAELPSGEYAVQTEFRLNGPPEGQELAGYAPAEYPVTGANGAGALQVHPGDQVQADISTRRERLYPVSIVLKGMPKDVLPSFTVRTMDGVEVPTLGGNAESGELQLFLPSGSFEISARGSVAAELHPARVPVAAASRTGQFAGAPLQLVGRQMVTVAEAPVNGVRMTLAPMATLEVELTSEKIANQAAEGLARAPLEPAQAANISLAPMDADSDPILYGAERVSDPHPGEQQDASLLIHNVPPGKYLLQAQIQPPWYVASASCGGADLTRESLAIAGSAAGCMIHVVLRDNSAALKVSTSDPQTGGAVPAFVYAIALDNLTRDVRALSTSLDGKASFDDVAPGRYLLLATRHDEDLAFRDAESLRRYETEGKRIVVAPGASADVQLDVLEGEP